MRKKDKQELEELLWEMGYDKKKYHKKRHRNKEMKKFIDQIDQEVMREAKRYVDFLNDTDDDFYINIKNIQGR